MFSNFSVKIVSGRQRLDCDQGSGKRLPARRVIKCIGKLICLAIRLNHQPVKDVVHII
jgi:hypothetical protein